MLKRASIPFYRALIFIWALRSWEIMNSEFISWSVLQPIFQATTWKIIFQLFHKAENCHDAIQNAFQKLNCKKRNVWTCDGRWISIIRDKSNLNMKIMNTKLHLFFNSGWTSDQDETFCLDNKQTLSNVWKQTAKLSNRNRSNMFWIKRRQKAGNTAENRKTIC